MDPGDRLTHLIDAAFAQQENEDGKRTHLGASVVGRKCLREVWLSWRWAGAEGTKDDGRMLRLFDRGDKEEERFAGYLRSVGATVWTHDANGKQFRISAYGGHLGGSLDGVATNIPGFPHGPAETPVVTEFKTHNDKSFKELLKKGVQASKPQHYNQAQLYMWGYGISWCLYMGVNKNDDSLYLRYFPYDAQIAHYLLARAKTVIFGAGAPPRITSDPTWFECRFCDFRRVCWKEKPLDQNCRTCRFAAPLEDGTWACAKGEPAITLHPKQGCDKYEPIPDI